LHSVLQIAVGWEDRHLHAFSVRTAGATRRFEMQETLDDEPDDDASSEERVRVDEVLTHPGSVMTYEYDFGDGWTHTVELEHEDSDIDDLRSICLDGARACPPESSGGPSRYTQALDIAADSSDPEHSELLSQWGPTFDPARFEVDAVNRVLQSADVGRSTLAEAVAAAPAIGRLFDRVRPTHVPSLMALLPRCELTVESSVDLPVAEIAMAKLTWFLRKVGDGGAVLTDAGYLKPAFVAAIRDELDWGLGWVGVEQPRDRPPSGHRLARGGPTPRVDPHREGAAAAHEARRITGRRPDRHVAACGLAASAGEGDIRDRCRDAVPDLPGRIGLSGPP
jgi:hypothetical protein